MNYKNCWLTLNRACNLRCSWCYAKDTNFKRTDDMPIELAYQIIDLAKNLEIKNITIIGGEPTLYPQLFDVINYIINKNMTCGLVTNGVLLSDEKFVLKLKESGIKNVSISLKGENKETFKQIAQIDCFDQVIKAISNCNKYHINCSTSMVLTSDNVDTYLEGVQAAINAGARRIHLSFCYDFNTSGHCSNPSTITDVKKIIDGFIKSYSDLNNITKGKFELFQSYPFCLWDDKFIALLNERHQISSICQLIHRTGLIFDTYGNIIPCNAMHTIKLGKINKDFYYSEDLLKYIEKRKIHRIYDKLCAVPSKECLKCKKLVYCGGGCVCQWTNYSFDDIRKDLLNYENKDAKN